MIKEIGKFNINETPHSFGYNAHDNYWYKNDDMSELEPKKKPVVIENFTINDMLGSKDKTEEENQNNLQNFVAYHFGKETGTKEYSFTMFDFPMSSISVELELWNFEEIELFVSELEKGENITRYCNKICAIKFYAWQKEDNKVRFALQKYAPINNDENADFKSEIIYDIIVDKTQLANELKRVIKKYSDKIVDEIKQYELENHESFTNPRKHIDLARLLNYKYKELLQENEEAEQKIRESERETNKQVDDSEFQSYDNWTAKKFITATELENFISEIKPQIINKPLNKILITGYLFDRSNYLEFMDGKYYACEFCGVDENDFTIINYAEEDYNPDDYLEDFVADLDEPAILYFGDTQVEIDFHEHSLIQMGINTLKEGEFNSYMVFDRKWKDISKHYQKNLIGHTLKDIYIIKTDQPSITWKVPREQGDDMYEEMVFVFDNGIELAVQMLVDYMMLAERKAEK